MKKFYVFFLIFILFTFHVYAKGQKEDQPSSEVKAQGGYPLRVVDDLDNELTLEKQPERILSGTLMTDEMLLGFVDKDRIVGVTAFSADPAISNVAAFVFDIPNKVTLNAEIYISLEPDLVFLADWTTAETVQQLRDAGLTVYLVKMPTTVAAIKETVLSIGTAVGEQQKAGQIVAWMEGELQRVADKVANLSEDQKKTVMDYGVWGDAMGKGSTWDEIINFAGLTNAVADLTPTEWGTVPISKEKLIDIDPDILVLPGWVYNEPAGPDAFFTQVVSDKALSELKAIKNKAVFRIPENHKSATSQYIVFAVEGLAKFAYPELFK